MFTGLVADIGTITAKTGAGGGQRITVRTHLDVSTVAVGESIAIDGACLTATDVGEDRFSVEVSPETLARTTLGNRRVGDAIHLERALRVGDRLGGHMVLGHVDGVGTLASRRRADNAYLLALTAPESVAAYLVEKGSITVDGVSLTVNWVDGDRFGVAIIAHTAEQTNLVDYAVGRSVNLESDVIGKYVEKLTSSRSGGISQKMLEDSGFGSGCSHE